MKTERGEKLAAILHDKTEYAMHIRNLKQALNYGLVLKTVPKVIEFNQNAWLKPYIDISIDLTKKHVRKYRDIKIITTEKRRNCLVSKPNFQTAKFFTENGSATKMKQKKTKTKTKKQSKYLGINLSI